MKSKQEFRAKIAKRFYVGSDRMMKDWPKATLEQAIAHAKQLLQEHPEKDAINIVQIIRVVRRKPSPVVVEKV